MKFYKMIPSMNPLTIQIKIWNIISTSEVSPLLSGIQYASQVTSILSFISIKSFNRVLNII